MKHLSAVQYEVDFATIGGSCRYREKLPVSGRKGSERAVHLRPHLPGDGPFRGPVLGSFVGVPMLVALWV